MKYEKVLGKQAEKCRGLGLFYPIKTSKIGDRLCCIRQKNVNIWFYRKNGQTIAIDAGYPDEPHLMQNLQRLGIDNEQIQAVFVTHGDIENAGGLSSQEKFAPNAVVHFHEKEEALVRGRDSRLKLGLFKVPSPLSYEGEYVNFAHKQIFDFETVEVQCFHCPGHSKGHSVFLLDRRYLFTGDSIAVNGEGGQSYFHAFNENTKENIHSLQALKENLVGREPETVFTSHNGSCPFEKAFSRISQVAKGTKSQPFDKKAPFDVFSENA